MWRKNKLSRSVSHNDKQNINATRK